MRLLRSIFALVLCAWTVSSLNAADAAAPAASAAHESSAGAPRAEPEHHGLPSEAVPLFNLGPLPVTNSMVVTWIVALGLIVFARLAMRNIQAVPSGAQNFWEFMVESLVGFLESILGPALARRTFWFFVTIFIFILFTN